MAKKPAARGAAAKAEATLQGKLHHPDADRPYAGETVAVPAPGFASKPGVVMLRSKR